MSNSLNKFTLLILLAASFSSCSKDPAPAVTTKDKQVNAAAELPVKPTPAPKKVQVFIQNGFDKMINITVKEEESLTIPPYKHAMVELFPGEHVFNINLPDQTTKTIVADVKENQTTVINPNGMTIFMRHEMSYGMYRVGGAKPPKIDHFKNQEVISVKVDYPLGQERPRKIMVSTSYNQMGNGDNERRISKLYKVPTTPLSPALAMEILEAINFDYQNEHI